MKRLMGVNKVVLGLGVFVSGAVSVAQACPNLDGLWTCHYEGSRGPRDFDFDIKTSNQKGITVYQSLGENIYMDGQSHHVDRLPILEQFANNINYTATCEGNTINLTGDATVTMQGMANGKTANVEGSLTLEDRNNVSTHFTASVGFFSKEFDVPCVRKR